MVVGSFFQSQFVQLFTTCSSEAYNNYISHELEGMAQHCTHHSFKHFSSMSITSEGLLKFVVDGTSFKTSFS